MLSLLIMPLAKKYIVLAGNIGVGKTSLLKPLAHKLGFAPYNEPVSENPYLVDFYTDMSLWAFHCQVFFLTYRIRAQQALSKESCSVIQDRSIYEDGEVFARNLHEQGFLSDRDWKTYRELYQTVSELLPSPDLVVYLKASVPTLKRRIQRRGRVMEANIDDNYLSGLNRLYDNWIDNFDSAKVLVVPCDRLDFVKDPSAFNAIVKEIGHRLRDAQGEFFPVGM